MWSVLMDDAVTGVLSLQDDASDDAACAATGTYTVTFAESCAAAVFSKPKDECSARKSQIMGGGWKPVHGNRGGGGGGSDTKDSGAIIVIVLVVVSYVTVVVIARANASKQKRANASRNLHLLAGQTSDYEAAP
jgi:hypothetical protein